MKKLLVATTLMACMFLGSFSVSAKVPFQKGFMPMPSKDFQMQNPMSEAERKAEMEKRKAEIDARLGVTEEQKTQIKAIQDKSKVEIAPKIRQLTDVEYEIGVLEKREINKSRYNINTLENVKLSGKSLEQLRSEEKTLREEIRKIRMAQFEELQKVFTAEQKKELEKMRKEHEKKFKKHKGTKGALKPQPPEK